MFSIRLFSLSASLGYSSSAFSEVKLTTLIRNIDRILTDSRIPSTEMLTYKDHGLLLCETHVLRQSGERLLPREVKREFLQDVGDLANLDTGIQNQRRIVKRIRWAYSRWLSS